MNYAVSSIFQKFVDIPCLHIGIWYSLPRLVSLHPLGRKAAVATSPHEFSHLHFSRVKKFPQKPSPSSDCHFQLLEDMASFCRSPPRLSKVADPKALCLWPRLKPSLNSWVSRSEQNFTIGNTWTMQPSICHQIWNEVTVVCPCDFFASICTSKIKRGCDRFRKLKKVFTNKLPMKPSAKKAPA